MSQDTDAVAQDAGTPGPVKIVSLLALLIGVLCLLGGILLIVAGFTNSGEVGQAPGWLIGQGVVYLVLGFAAMSVYKALNRGNSWARMVFTVVLVLAIIVNVARIASGHGADAWWGLAIEVIALVILFVPQSSRDFFARSSAS